jgi:hypothetical protein
MKCQAPLTLAQIAAIEMLWRGGVHKVYAYCDPCFPLVQVARERKRAQAEKKRYDQE